MRVISGTARSVPLLSREGLDTRPTSDRVKEAVFNVLQFEIEGRSVLDLFGGSGQMAIEALSRGAASAVFVDQSKAAVALVKKNLEKTKLTGGRVVQGDSIAFLSGPGKFDLVFLDPPYDSGLLENALKKDASVIS